MIRKKSSLIPLYLHLSVEQNDQISECTSGQRQRSESDSQAWGEGGDCADRTPSV